MEIQDPGVHRKAPNDLNGNEDILQIFTECCLAYSIYSGEYHVYTYDDLYIHVMYITNYTMKSWIAS